MKDFLFRHPALAGVLVFLVTAIGGSVLSYFLCQLILETTGPSDPHHGGLMLAFGLLLTLVSISWVAAVALGIYCKNYLKRKAEGERP